MLLPKLKIAFAYCYTFCITSFLSKRYLAKIIREKTFPKMEFHPYFSGRVAIHHLADQLKNSQKKALIPDYICNVVNIALEKAGYQLYTYSLNDEYEANINEVISIIKREEITLLLTASIYGSSAMINDLRNKELEAAIKEQNTHILIDLCQDIRLTKELSKELPENISIAVSFNDKSFVGAMGGGLFTNIAIKKEQKKLKISLRIKLYILFLKKIISPPFVGKSDFEYSFCKEYPFELSDYTPLKFQLVLALCGIKCLNLYNAVKMVRLQKIKTVLKTKFFSTAAYIQILGDYEIKRVQKPPYAQHHNPGLSLHPEIKIIHNKGFLDG